MPDTREVNPMVTVTIPSIGADPLIVEINNDRYSYRAGETYEVMEDVAQVIESLIASFPKEGRTPVGGGGVMIVGVQDGTYTLDKKYSEITAAMSAGIPVIYIGDTYDNPGFESLLITSAVHNEYDNEYVITAGISPNNMIFKTNSADGYPAGED